MRRAALALLSAAMLVGTACAPDDVAEPTPTPLPEATPEPAEPVGEANTDEKATDDFPTGGGEVALLTDVRVSGQDDFDRIVLQFRGEDVPSWRVTYIDAPVREDGSGREISVEGSAFLELRIAPASGVVLRGEQPERTYEGPDRISPTGTSVVREVVRTGDFEANLAWVVGLDGRVPFAADFLTDPLRLVVDVVPD